MALSRAAAAPQPAGLKERLWAQRDRAFGLPVRDWRAHRPARPAARAGFDQAWCGVAGAAVAFGLVMVYSASVALPDNPKFARYSPTFFLTRHLLSIGIGLVCALVVAQVPISFWERRAKLVFVAALVLLVVVLIPGIGKVVNFSRRWIPLGFMNFQPSELAKLAIALYAASYMVRKMDVKENFFQAVWPMAVAVAFVGLLLLRQPDMGAFIVIAAIAMGILFLGGVNGRMFFLIAAVLVATFALIIAFDDLRRERILAYLDPWNPQVRAGQGLPADAFADRLRPRRDLRPGPGRQRREAALPARGAHRLPARGDRRGTGLRRRGDGHRALLLADAAHLRHRPPGHRARPRLRRADGAGHRHVDRRPGLHQHGRQPRRAADQGPDAAADELRRLGDPDEPDRAGDRGAGGSSRTRRMMRGGRRKG
jgi:hypothetical protein